MIDFSYRKKNWRYRQPFWALDVTRTQIRRPWNKDKYTNARIKYYWSAKDKIYALKYEVGVSLGEHCKIIYVSGPCPGSVHDIKIARHSSLLHLERGEKVVADLGYIGQDNQVITPVPYTKLRNAIQNKFMGYLIQNVERMNNRIKIFNAAGLWRGKKNFHKYIFHACCYITNLELEVTPLNGGNANKR